MLQIYNHENSVCNPQPTLRLNPAEILQNKGSLKLPKNNIENNKRNFLNPISKDFFLRLFLRRSN